MDSITEQIREKPQVAGVRGELLLIRLEEVKRFIARGARMGIEPDNTIDAPRCSPLCNDGRLRPIDALCPVLDEANQESCRLA